MHKILEIIIILLFTAFFVDQSNIPRKIILKNSTKQEPVSKENAEEISILDRIDEIAIKHDLDPIILQEVVRQESRFNSSAIGDKGQAKGLGQVQYRWHKKTCALKSSNQLLDPETNLNCSAKILKNYLSEVDSLKISQSEKVRIALARYNGGYSNSRKSKEYANTVLNKIKKQIKYLG